VLGVNTFIAISGWFGIHFKGQGLAKYLFQVLFVLWSVYGIAIALGLMDFNLAGVQTSMALYDGYWFVIGYLGLYLISPILNKFVEYASKREFQVVLISYYLFQGYFNWLSAWYDYYSGCSIILFGGIYLTTAYLRKYPVAWLYNHSGKLLIATVLVMATVAYLSMWKFGHAARQIRDDNPLVILAAILLVMTFSKLKLQSKLVNWLAASCFTVYLIHYHPIVYQHLMVGMRQMHLQFDGLIYAVLLIASLLAIYVLCTLCDQIRLLAWNVIQKTMKTSN